MVVFLLFMPKCFIFEKFIFIKIDFNPFIKKYNFKIYKKQELEISIF